MPLNLDQLVSDAQGYTQSDDFKKLLPYLLSGGVGAAAGGLMTGGRRKEKGEGRLGYLGRVLGNAAITGGLAAGGHALINKGIESTVGNLADEKGNISGASKQDEGPLSTTIKNIAFSPLTALGSAGSVLAATHDHKLIGAGDTKAPLESFAKHVTGKSKGSELLRTKTPEAIAGMVHAPGASPAFTTEAERLRRLAGLASAGESGSKIRGALSSLSRTGLGSTFGQTMGRRAGRGAIGLAAAGLPALIGALLTNDTQQPA